MEFEGLQNTNPSRTFTEGYDHEKGFALITMLVLIPALFAMCLALGALFICARRKTLAQSLCVHQAMYLQSRLAVSLEQLLKLNKRAKILRTHKKAVDLALKTALVSENPPAIAAAKAAQLAVILQQSALAFQQQRWLRQADTERLRSDRTLQETTRRLGPGRIQAKRFYPLGLAVYPAPPGSLTPDYKTVPMFKQLQQHRYRFALDLLPGSLFTRFGVHTIQTAECSATLTQQEEKWIPALIAANALSN